MQPFERYWLFALCCVLVGLFTLRLVLRERLTLQGSLSLLAFLSVMAGVALFPGLTSRIAHRMGFTLPSNFFFALSITVLALLYLGAQITISRIELRTIALTQEVSLLREKLERATATAATAGKSPLEAAEPLQDGAAHEALPLYIDPDRQDLGPSPAPSRSLPRARRTG